MEKIKTFNGFNFLEETLDLAGSELIKRFGAKLNIEYKNDASIVTDADTASEKIILDRIKKFFPDDEVFSEECGRSSERRKPGTYIWIIDPLDGTTNFANKYPFFCISIARAKFLDGGDIEILLGGVFDPIRNRKYMAAKTEGAFCNGDVLRVAPPRPFEKSYLCTGFYYNRGKALQADLDLFAKIAHQCQAIRRDGAAALDFALVAAGVFDGFWERGLKPWDIAAGSLLVSEAGGKIRNYYQNANSKFNLEADGIIAGSAAIVDTIAQFI